MTLFRIDFHVLSQNLSKIGPAGAVLGLGKVGGAGLGRTFSVGMVWFSCFFFLLSFLALAFFFLAFFIVWFSFLLLC